MNLMLSHKSIFFLKTFLSYFNTHLTVLTFLNLLILSSRIILFFFLFFFFFLIPLFFFSLTFFNFLLFFNFLQRLRFGLRDYGIDLNIREIDDLFTIFGTFSALHLVFASSKCFFSFFFFIFIFSNHHQTFSAEFCYFFESIFDFSSLHLFLSQFFFNYIIQKIAIMMVLLI